MSTDKTLVWNRGKIWLERVWEVSYFKS